MPSMFSPDKELRTFRRRRAKQRHAHQSHRLPTLSLVRISSGLARRNWKSTAEGGAAAAFPEGGLPLLKPSQEAMRPRRAGQHPAGMSPSGINARRPCQFRSSRNDARAAEEAGW